MFASNIILVFTQTFYFLDVLNRFFYINSNNFA